MSLSDEDLINENQITPHVIAHTNFDLLEWINTAELGMEEYYTYNEVDPDINWYISNKIRPTEYITVDTYNKMSESWNEIYPRVNAMFYMNIRSLSKHYDELQMLLLQNQFQMLTVCLTETWLKNENVNLYNLPGYNSVNNYRMKKPGGGVTIMIREDLPFNYIDQLTYIDHNIESIGVKLQKNPLFFTRDTIICCIYRPPQGDIKEFAKKFNQILEKVSKNKTYIFGDFNIDLKKKSEHSEILLNSKEY